VHTEYQIYRIYIHRICVLNYKPSQLDPGCFCYLLQSPRKRCGMVTVDVNLHAQNGISGQW
jgi:hypothetical protein